MKINNELLQKIKNNDLSVFDVVKLYGIFANLEINDLNYIKLFINNYYHLEEIFPDNFYKMFLKEVQGDKYKELLDIILQKDIFLLINFLKYGKNYKLKLDKSVTPLKYFNNF